VPNVALREHDIEQFEDDPLEFIRLDLSVSSAGTDLATRRQAAADVLQALVGAGSEAEATEVAGTWITSGLAQYEANKAENWKAKDGAIYLLTAVATRGSTSQVGAFELLVHDESDLALAWCDVDQCARGCRKVLFGPRFSGFAGRSRDCTSHTAGRCYPVPVHIQKSGQSISYKTRKTH
jgi:hypothetical protein